MAVGSSISKVLRKPTILKINNRGNSPIIDETGFLKNKMTHKVE